MKEIHKEGKKKIGEAKALERENQERGKKVDVRMIKSELRERERKH